MTDAGLRELKPSTGLTVLDLSGTAVTDAGLKHLAGSKGLKRLALGEESRVTDAGARELIRVVPACTVTR